MFKRVEKRRKKKEEEEELGLDEDMKEVLGLQDTDSEESDSDTSSGESEQEGGNGSEDEDADRRLGRNKGKRKRKIGEAGESDEEGDDRPENEEDEEEGEEGGDEDESEDEGDTDKPPISVGEALRETIFVVTLEPDVKACVVCPDKLLKNIKMEEVHKTSNAHKRRFKRFATLARLANPEDNAWDVLREAGNLKPAASEEATSKRAEKRKTKLAVVKAKREKGKLLKAQAKAKKEAKTASLSESPGKTQQSSTEHPVKKKPKLDHQPPPTKLRKPASKMAVDSKKPIEHKKDKEGKGVVRGQALKPKSRGTPKKGRRRSTGDTLQTS